MRKIFVTTSIPYVNAEPHVGFALELVQADVIARYNRLLGRQVRLQTGTDENAIKNVLGAQRLGLSVQELVDRNSGRFRDLVAALDISADDFIRTTEGRHRQGVHEFWRRLREGDVYRKEYIGLYCAGCEDFYLPRDLSDGLCPEHRTKPLEVTEENYFFRLSAWQEQLERLLVDGVIQVDPPSRLNEVLAFVRQGLRDFSVSRLASRTFGWGTPVPEDPSQVLYVWVDALVNYLSAPGLGSGDAWRQWWNGDADKVHVIGKNVWKFHAIYWPALLLSAGLPLPDRIVVHGFLTVDGQKIGKSLGNAIDPFACIERFGSDAVRYYLLRAVSPFGDGDFSLSRVGELYRSDLANGLGNLVSRLARLCEASNYGCFGAQQSPQAPDGYHEAVERCQFDQAAATLWQVVSDLNRDIEAVRPWESLATGHAQELHSHLNRWLIGLHALAYWLSPFLPRAAEEIRARLFTGSIRSCPPLFPRLK